MELNYGILATLYGTPIVVWLGVILYMRTFTADVSQIQSMVLFMLAFFLLGSFVALNVAVRGDLTLLTIALVETLILAGTVGFKLRKVTAKLK